VKLPPEQAQIPLIVKASMPLTIEQRAEYQQQDVFDSVLSLFSIQTSMFTTAGAFIQTQTSAAFADAPQSEH
jgi:hypothetical protein